MLLRTLTLSENSFPLSWLHPFHAITAGSAHRCQGICTCQIVRQLFRKKILCLSFFQRFFNSTSTVSMTPSLEERLSYPACFFGGVQVGDAELLGFHLQFVEGAFRHPPGVSPGNARIRCLRLFVKRQATVPTRRFRSRLLPAGRAEASSRSVVKLPRRCQLRPKLVQAIIFHI